MEIDLNADLGESFGPWPMGDDAAMLDIVTSANVACGFHAGDPVEMRRVARMCAEKGVGLGAHPGFRDLEGFGRRRIEGLSDEDIAALTVYQIGAMQAAATSVGARVRHVKMHGALANMCSESSAMARAYVAAAQSVDPALIILAIAGTALESEAAALGVPRAAEVFADRAYLDNGLLAPRGTPGAMIHDPNQAADAVLRMVDEQALTSLNGVKIPVNVESVCVHGDSPGAVRLAETVRRRLEGAGARVRPFSGRVN